MATENEKQPTSTTVEYGVGRTETHGESHTTVEDLTPLPDDVPALIRLRTRADQKIKTLQDAGRERLHKKFHEEATAHGLTLDEIVNGSGKSRRTRRAKREE